jgi:hypothetical protein
MRNVINTLLLNIIDIFVIFLSEISMDYNIYIKCNILTHILFIIFRQIFTIQNLYILGIDKNACSFFSSQIKYKLHNKIYFYFNFEQFSILCQECVRFLNN